MNSHSVGSSLRTKYVFINQGIHRLRDGIISTSPSLSDKSQQSSGLVISQEKDCTAQLSSQSLILATRTSHVLFLVIIRRQDPMSDIREQTPTDIL